MKEAWYFSVILLMLGIFAGFSSMVTPTSAFAVNIPPQWDFPTREFVVDSNGLHLNLKEAFFDPDDDPLSFSVSPSAGISAGIDKETLVVLADKDGEITITASDGKMQVSKTIMIHVK